ncbi:uncharacterized protein LOC111700496 [Eurytemora carolleeae]|uniref:uncharacterized protein LOC111700496 n=1 Tax=Eurytemora carolleeae TaxID=1294199 RepID=UPI000C787B92|nr:uncharacterized protein LOC111700496 [Eurytemora carolleeae]|eukprot:XP_023327194.1 uncharacterized protein LOC111700496 [Eurytemora affinis]
MKKCCCCGVKTASVVLGTFNLFLSILLIIPLAAYLANSEVPGLNPIKDNQKYIENVLEDILREHRWTMQTYQEIMGSAREWWPTSALIALSLSAISATSALLLILGVRCQVRFMMVPYLVLTMLDIILAGAGGIVIVVALFYANIIPGVVSAAVYIILAVLSLYSWTAVLAAYQILESGEYEYSPAPTKSGIKLIF